MRRVALAFGLALLLTAPAQALPVGVLAFQDDYDLLPAVSDWLSRSWGQPTFQVEGGALEVAAPGYGDYLELWKHVVTNPAGSRFEVDVTARQLHRFSMDLSAMPPERWVAQDAPEVAVAAGLPPASWTGVHFAMHDLGFAFCSIQDDAVTACAWGPNPGASVATTMRLEAQPDGVVRATALRGSTVVWTAAWTVPGVAAADYDFLLLHTWNVGRPSAYSVDAVRMGPGLV